MPFKGATLFLIHTYSKWKDRNRTVCIYDVDGVDMVRLFSCRISLAKLVMLVISYLNGVDWVWVYGMLYAIL